MMSNNYLTYERLLWVGEISNALLQLLEAEEHPGRYFARIVANEVKAELSEQGYPPQPHRGRMHNESRRELLV